MKILMTGITGFIGHHLAERLINDGHEVYAIVRPTSKIDELSDNLRRNVQFHVYDKDNTVLDIITDLCVDDRRPDVVYHLATNFMNAHRFEDIQDLIQSNITFGTELLDAMVANNVYNFINVGTFTQHYDDAEYSPVNLYAATKECFEGIIKYYAEARNLKCIALHLFDTYGADDKRGKILGLLKKISESGETLKMSPGGQLMDLVYVDDVIEAFIIAGKLLAACKYDYCDTYGVSSTKPIPLREVVKIFENVAGKKLSIEWGGRPYRAREVMVPWKSYKLLPGWSPKVSLQEGIKKFLGVI
ncbi:MAG: NAD(P)-dependent oxidoreductase [Selenomonadaceae bacterium]|nr:NAD(P)-dependent oxidoreductase [Selenomonadaceae bacterium]